MSYTFSMEQNHRERFGLMSAGIGAMVAAIALATGTLDLPQIIASSFLVLVGLAFFVGPN